MEFREPNDLLSKFFCQASLGALFLASGCATYEARPLKAEEKRAAWLERTVEDERVAEFVERLEALGAESPEELTFDASDGLTLSEARLFALVYHPDLRLARLRVERARVSAEAAGLWMDPRFSLNLLRISESVPDRWIVNPALVFTMPLSGRLQADRDWAAARMEVSEFEALEAERSVWMKVRAAWARWSAAELRVEVLEQFLNRADELNETTAHLSRLGEIRSTEAALFEIETLQRKNQLLRERGEFEAVEQEIRHLLGLSPEAALRFVPSLDAGNPELGEIGDGHPTLARLRAAYAASESRLRREVRKQVPDLTLGPQFEEEEGQSRIGIQGGLPLPLFNANKRAIAQAEVDRELARAAYENAYQDLVARRSAVRARADALVNQRESMKRELIPLVDESLLQALEIMQLGEGSALVALESQVRALDARLRWIDLQAEEVVLQAELEALSGTPILPSRTDLDEPQSEDAL